MKFHAAIFDLDGTILDSMDVWENIDIAFLKSVVYPCQAAMSRKFAPAAL